MSLRPMTWQDIAPVAALEPALFGPDAWTEQTWWAELAARPRRSYVVAQDGPVLAGYAGIDRGGEVADVMTIAVAPPAQGRGWGARLMAHLATDARRGGAHQLILEVRADNAPARGLYARLGFEPVRVRRRYYQPGDVDAIVLRLNLREVAR